MKIRRQPVSDVVELSRWKLSLAVSFSAVTGYLLFSGAESVGGTAAVFHLSGTTVAAGAFLSAAGVFLLSAGASALNQYTERKSDALMERTAGRPLPSGRMAPPAALAAAALLLAAGSILLAVCGTVPLLLGATSIILYNVIYTGLKKKTTLAIIPGALVGAVPPLIGYTAAGGAMTDMTIILFALFMFLWQMPHFWLLLLRYGEEYEKAGIKTFHRILSDSTIVRLVMAWITGSSILLWILAAIYMPFSHIAAIMLLVLNVIFILAFARIIGAGLEGPRSRYAFVAFNSFTAIV
ncbi:MAG: protoheme IX farnesyltransferase, partial [Bacteroidetes bacterium]